MRRKSVNTSSFSIRTMFIIYIFISLDYTREIFLITRPSRDTFRVEFPPPEILLDNRGARCYCTLVRRNVKTRIYFSRVRDLFSA